MISGKELLLPRGGPGHLLAIQGLILGPVTAGQLAQATRTKTFFAEIASTFGCVTSASDIMKAIGISVRGYRKKSLSLSGAISAVIVGFCLTLANYCYFLSLICFFFTSSFWTKWKSEKKKKIEEQFKEGGQRNWLQVFCNGGFPVVISCVYLLEVGCRESPINYAKDFIASALNIALLGALACCNGDTWSSEIGTAVGPKTPRLITTFKRVPVGTNGAISIIGTLSSVVGGLVIGLVYYLTVTVFCNLDHFSGTYPPQWPIIIIGTLAGFVGSIVDSILGATLQYSGYCERERKVVSKPSRNVKHICGRNILDNHLVNLVSSSMTGIMMSFLGYAIWEYIDETGRSAI
eukprot:gene13001-14341_t